MSLKATIENLLNQALEAKPELFLINFSITSNNTVIITLDGDEGVKLQDCIEISRAIESNIDEDAFDFTLEVASCGAESPVKYLRQLPKNINRNFEVQLENKNFEAVLTAIENDKLTFEWSSREPKQVGKGKETVQHKETFSFDQIKEMKVKITFN